MAYNTTPTYGLKYPTSDEEMNIPEDLQILADSMESAMVTLVNNNLIKSAVARLNAPPEAPDFCAAVVNNGVLSLIYPRAVSDSTKLGNTGDQTLNGNLNVTGKITATTPTAATHVATKGYVDGLAMPIGTIVAWAGSSTSPPAGWLFCDGQAFTGAAALQAVLGVSNTPDLRDKFIVGKSPTKPQGPGGTTGSITLTTNQLPAHSHTMSQDTFKHKHENQVTGNVNGPTTHVHPLPTVATVNLNHDHLINVGTASANHTHHISLYSNTDGAHYHTTRLQVGSELGGTGINYLTEGTTNTTAVGPDGTHRHAIIGDTGQQSATHTHTADVLPLSTINPSYAAITQHTHNLIQSTAAQPDTNHTHNFTTSEVSYTHGHTINNSGSGQAFSVLPPYYAFAYIIYKGA